VVVLAAAVGITYAVTRSHRPKSVSSSATTLAPAPDRSTPPSTAASAPTTQPAATFASLYQSDVSGVIRIDATTCAGSGVGSGVLITPTLVATAAHVVDGAVTVGLSNGGHTSLGHVIGISDANDVALVEVTAPFTGHTFSLASTIPPVGTTVGVIGYPEGGPVSFSQGSISGLDRTIDIQGQPRSGLIQTDAALNPGNSGGPLLLLNGSVVGLADAINTSAAGLGYAIPSTTAQPLLANWQSDPSPPSTAACSNPLGPSGFGQIQGGPSVPSGITATLSTYFDSIDTGDYATAYAQLSPAEQATISESQFAANDATSYDYNITVGAIAPGTAGTDLVDVSFTSLQSAAEGPNGDQCDNWTLEYTMTNSAGAWLIQAANGQGGVTHLAC
jgi:serine protease Do